MVLQQQQSLSSTASLHTQGERHGSAASTSWHAFSTFPRPTNGYQGENMAVYKGILDYLNAYTMLKHKSTSCRSNNWPTSGL